MIRHAEVRPLTVPADATPIVAATATPLPGHNLWWDSAEHQDLHVVVVRNCTALTAKINPGAPLAFPLLVGAASGEINTATYHAHRVGLEEHHPHRPRRYEYYDFLPLLTLQTGFREAL